jgi:WD40 repeat protein
MEYHPKTVRETPLWTYRPVLCLDISCDWEVLASGSEDCTVRLWDLKTGTKEGFIGFWEGVSSIRISRDVGLVAIGMEGGAIHVLDMQTLSVVGLLEEHVSALVFSASSTELTREGYLP